uniref:Uncharacterized protein n=1 Tax=Lepeophtheirus salmonis TaxID=72036 RepID=A0A0K2U5R4_LEPSM
MYDTMYHDMVYISGCGLLLELPLDSNFLFSQQGFFTVSFFMEIVFPRIVASSTRLRNIDFEESLSYS